MHPCTKFGLAVLCFGLSLWATPVLAQSTSLTDVAAASNFNALERAAASANQETYNQLVGPCSDPSGQTPCGAADQNVFQRTRELVETANELLGSGPTRFSLGLDARGLGFALRWTAAEEIAAQGSSSTRFAASQLSALATRTAALRWGVSGLRTAQNGSSPQQSPALGWSGFATGRGGGASGDGADDANRWGPFINDSFGYGSKDPTDLEDAFDFDGHEATAGIDYRFTPSKVAGVLLGYSKKRIDFDSTVSIVDGDMRTDGVSLIVFGMLEGDKAYVSGSIGYQQLSHDLTRRISYPSFNTLVPSVDSTARSSADSSTLLAMVDAGYTWRMRAFSIEPNLQVQYTRTKVDAFDEQSVNNLSPGTPDPFSMSVGEQTIKLVDIAPALKLQYVLKPPFGVLIPYVVGRFHLEASNSARAIASRYADALNFTASSSGTNFAVSTDDPDKRYWTIAAGASVVLPHGWQGFIQYLSVEDLDNYSDHVITGGIRFEF
jgi:hypothetical protein